MWTCPVCDTKTENPLCPACGYDRSRDYERYPTFGVVRGAASTAALREKRAPKAAMRCPKCGGTAFTIRVPDGARRCRECGWTPDPAPRLRCGCGGTLFAVRMTDGALECPLCGGVLSLGQVNSWFSREAAKPQPAPEKPKAPAASLLDHYGKKPADARARKAASPAKAPAITAIAAGGQHSAALYADGTVRAIGSNKHGQCDTSTWKNIVAIDAGYHHTAGKQADGTWLVTGEDQRQLAELYNKPTTVAIADGPDHRVTIRTDGFVCAWIKRKPCGTVRTETSSLNTTKWFHTTAIAAGHSHTVGLTQAGTVVATGSDLAGQCKVDSWSGITAIAAGHSHTVGLKKDGTVVFAGTYDNSWNRPSELRQWKDITAIAAGAFYTIGLKKDGTLVVSGTDINGACDIKKLMSP